ncbi:MAG: D-erythronate dehydrogenase [Burkholderiales bacterium]
MKILITGGCGFLGARLARTLLARERFSLAGRPAAPITRIVLADRVAPPGDLAADPRIEAIEGDLIDLLEQQRLSLAGVDAVVHLAAAVSAECEADLDLGLRSNLQATLALLQACRTLPTAPVFVFSSSLAVFGSTPQGPMPAVILDDTLPTPQGSYGIQKFMCEQLVADFGRKGFVDARNVRLMTVSVRPGRPNGAASGFLSGMIREPLAAQACTVPVAAETRVALASPAATIAGLMRTLECAAQHWGARTAVNFPSVSVTVGEMAQALRAVGGASAHGLLTWNPDPAIERLVGSWPGRFRTDRAQNLGLPQDPDFESVIRDYIRENPSAVA